jgi:hypothetical protein
MHSGGLKLQDYQVFYKHTPPSWLSSLISLITISTQILFNHACIMVKNLFLLSQVLESQSVTKVGHRHGWQEGGV